MQASKHILRKRFARLVVAGALAAGGTTAGMAIVAGSSGATGTMTCPNYDDTDAGPVDAGMTGYLVIGSSVDGTSSTLSGTYTLGDATFTFSQDGVQQGQGAFHYVFQLPQGAQITAWSVTGATTTTVITVSGCLNGETVPTVPTVPTTTTTTLAPNDVVPGGPSVAGEVVTREGSPAAVAAAAVTASPNLTG